MLSQGVWLGSHFAPFLLITSWRVRRDGQVAHRSVLEELMEQENGASLSFSDKGSFLILSQLGMAPGPLVHSLIKPYVPGIP